jgi:acetyl-CoA carboxylase biotin carboxylase subunit
VKPFQKVLVANRGEIAVRVIRACRDLGLRSVAIYSDVDRAALHVSLADEAWPVGEAPARESYLDMGKVLEAARRSGAGAIHPGYGFLSENAAFARACEDAGLVFIGPRSETIALLGEKTSARRVAVEAGVPVVPGTLSAVATPEDARREAEKIGLPVMLKAAAGGGGKGIRIVREEKQLLEAFHMARAEAKGAFGDDRIYLEKFVTRPRHVEIQVMADKHGNVVHYGERECSVQRRHQKLVEESPCAALTPELRAQMGKAACDLARAVGYVGAGTVEFLYSEGRFYFLEMNTRLQVEHPVTEMRFGVDLVREQIRVGAGEKVAPVPEPLGHAIEVRVNAEDPANFFPSLGRIARINLPGGPGVRLDSALFRGMEVTPFYDSMLAKLVVHGADRAQAIARCSRALRELRIVGVSTSLSVALAALRSDEFVKGEYDTGILERIDKKPTAAHAELAALAAAATRFLLAERAGATTEAGPQQDRRNSTPRWAMLGRTERLRRSAP